MIQRPECHVIRDSVAQRSQRYAFASRGWKIEPWEDAAQKLGLLISFNRYMLSRMDKDKDVPLTGARDATFKHYCSCYPGGKPTYNLKLAKQDGPMAAEKMMNRCSQDSKLFKEGGQHG